MTTPETALSVTTEDKVVNTTWFKHPQVHCSSGGIGWGVNLYGYLPSRDEPLSYIPKYVNIYICMYIVYTYL